MMKHLNGDLSILELFFDFFCQVRLLKQKV